MTTAKPKAEFSVSHLKDSQFVSEGLRSFFEYRDLGIKAATGGRVGAHVIRAKPGMHGASGWHTHDLEVQLVYVLKGWVEFDYEGVGPLRIEPSRAPCPRAEAAPRDAAGANPRVD